MQSRHQTSLYRPCATTCSRHDLALAAELLDAQLDDVAGIEKDGVRLDSHADARRRPGGDHVARMQAHELAEVVHEERRLEDHGLGRAVLAPRAVHVQPHGKIRGIADFIGRDQPGTQRAKSIAALALVPLAAALELEGAFGQIVDDAVPGDVPGGIRLADVARHAADHHAELDFPVHLGGAARFQHRVVGSGDAARGLHEHDGFGRNLGAGFGGMIGVVEPDGDEFSDPAHAGAEPYAGRGAR